MTLHNAMASEVVCLSQVRGVSLQKVTAKLSLGEEPERRKISSRAGLQIPSSALGGASGQNRSGRGASLDQVSANGNQETRGRYQALGKSDG